MLYTNQRSKRNNEDVSIMCSLFAPELDIDAINNYRLGCKDCLISVNFVRKSKRQVAAAIYTYRQSPQSEYNCPHHFIIHDL